MVKIQKQLDLTCPACFSTFQLLEIHERETKLCEANCLEQWQKLLHDHYQQQIILHLAHEEAQKEEAN